MKLRDHIYDFLFDNLCKSCQYYCDECGDNGDCCVTPDGYYDCPRDRMRDEIERRLQDLEWVKERLEDFAPEIDDASEFVDKILSQLN